MTQNNKNQQDPVSLVRVSGSKGTDDHVASNIADNNPATRFSTKGIGSYFDVEYNREFDFNTLSLILFRGAQRKTTFSVAYTNDFQKFKPTKPATFTSTGNDTSADYHFQKVKAKGARISFEGHLPNSYSGADQVRQGGQSGVQPATNPGQTTKNLGDSSADSDYFSVIGASLTHQDLSKEEEKQLKELAKVQKEECTDCKCLRCGCDCNDGICENCGIKGHYEHSPISVTPVDHIVDTTPSASQPEPLVVDENARKATTVPLGASAQAGNVVTKGIEIDKNVAEGNVPPAKDNFVGQRTQESVSQDQSAAAKNNTARVVDNDKNVPTGNFPHATNNNDLGPAYKTNDPQGQGIREGEPDPNAKSLNNSETKANNKNKFAVDKADSSFSTSNNKANNKNIKEGDTVETQTTIVDKKDVQ